ncbi:MAG: hypothetical protein E7434_05915 [Ruminococcaceae bacterium]|nr:hypothetical protein [Oscillospiraceae bacterium]
MKKFLALILALTMVFALVACGEKEPEATDTPATDAPADNGGAADISGETYNAGNFTALVPDGWMAIPVTDMWSDDGAADPDALQIIKDGASEFDILTKAYIQFDYYAPETDLMIPSSEWYDEAADLDPIVAGSYTWNGFTAVSGGNTMITLWTGEAGGPQFQATLWCNGENVISASDADVLAILASVVPAA